MVKVVPTFINRDFSVPATSNLRPHLPNKRPREGGVEHTDKRRRVDQAQLNHVNDLIDPLRDQPIPTTESERSAENSPGAAAVGVEATGNDQNGVLVERSDSESQLIFVEANRTGGAEFGPDIKEESPELGQPHRPTTRNVAAAKWIQSSSKPVPQRSPRKPRLPKSQPKALRSSLQKTPQALAGHNEPDMEDRDSDAALLQSPRDEEDHPMPGPAGSPDTLFQAESHDPSAQVAAEPSRRTSLRRAANSTDVYEVPSSPDFTTARTRRSGVKLTYSRTPRKPNTIQKEVDMLNNSRRKVANTQAQHDASETAPVSTSKMAHAFQVPQHDEIESTPQDGTVHTPTRPTPVKPGSLKKPSRETLLSTPVRAKRGAQHTYKNFTFKDYTPSNKLLGSTTKTLAPEVQARLDRINRTLGMSDSIAEQPSPQDSSQLTQATQSSAAPISKDIDTFTPTNGVAASVGRRSSVQPVGSNSKGASQSLVQPPPPHKTPLKSPVPLPENVRQVTAALATVSTPKSVVKDDQVFKKPPPRLRSSVSKSASEERIRKSSQRRSSGSLTAADPPLQDEIHSVPEPNESIRKSPAKTSTASNRTHGLQRGGPFPLSSTPLSGSESAHEIDQISNHRSRVLGQGTPQSTATSTRKRGRPKKSASIVPTDSPEPTPNSPLKSESRSQAESRMEPTAIPAPASVDIGTIKPVVEDAIVISSVEPSSSEYSDSEQDAPVTVNGTSKTAQPKVMGGQSKQIDTSSNGQDAQNEQEKPPTSNAVAPSTQTAKGDRQPTGKNASGKSSAWHTQLWDFANVDESNESNDKHHKAAATKDHMVSQASRESTEIDFEENAASEVGSVSESVSAAVSTRSSPAVTRRPARFLSQSPTPIGSDGEEEFEEPSAASSKPEVLSAAADENESESASSSDSDESASDDEETQLPGIPTEDVPGSTTKAAKADVPSSPPHVTAAPNSTPLVPETSQQAPSQAPRGIQVPLPTNGHAPSSQSVSAQAAARRPLSRQTTFGTLREQLNDAKKKRAAPAQSKPFDPRTTSLKSLAAKKKGLLASQIAAGDSDSSDDDSSSSSSDSD